MCLKYRILHPLSLQFADAKIQQSFEKDTFEFRKKQYHIFTLALILVCIIGLYIDRLVVDRDHIYMLCILIDLGILVIGFILQRLFYPELRKWVIFTSQMMFFAASIHPFSPYRDREAVLKLDEDVLVWGFSAGLRYTLGLVFFQQDARLYIL